MFLNQAAAPREPVGEPFMTPKTVEARRSRICRKPGVRSRAELAPQARTPEWVALSQDTGAAPHVTTSRLVWLPAGRRTPRKTKPEAGKHNQREVPIVIGGVTQVVIQVEDQDRAKVFWTE